MKSIRVAIELISICIATGVYAQNADRIDNHKVVINKEKIERYKAFLEDGNNQIKPINIKLTVDESDEIFKREIKLNQEVIDWIKEYMKNKDNNVKTFEIQGYSIYELKESWYTFYYNKSPVELDSAPLKYFTEKEADSNHTLSLAD